MTTIYCNGYSATKGTTGVSKFWSDMHILDFRAEKPIMTHADLKEQVEKFEADRAAFDVVNYDMGSKPIKANREYDCIVERRVDFEVYHFLYQGKEYHYRSRFSFKTRMKIRENAEKILAHYTEQMLCLVWDATGEVVGEGKLLGKIDNMLTPLF